MNKYPRAFFVRWNCCVCCSQCGQGTCDGAAGCRKELKEQLGITVSFIATHTGLTRWHDYPLSLDAEESAGDG